MACTYSRTNPGSQSGQIMVTTTVFITNLHCPSCVEVIQDTLSGFTPAPEFVSYSIVSHSVVLRHGASLAVRDITATLEAAGFEIHSIFQDNKPVFATGEVCRNGRDTEWESSLEHAVAKWFQKGTLSNSRQDMYKRERHAEQCEQCKAEAGGVQLNANSAQESWNLKKPQAVITTDSLSQADTFDGARSPVLESIVIDAPSVILTCKTTIGIQGMTCSSCVSSITHAVQQLPFVRSTNVNLLTNSGTVVFEGKEKVREIVQAIEDAGFDANIESIEHLDTWRATYAIGGMTCSACVGNVSRALEAHSWIERVDVNLVTNSASVVFAGSTNVAQITDTIEDAGYEAKLDKLEPTSAIEETSERSVGIRIDGMFCHHCPHGILRMLQETYGGLHSIDFEEQTFSETSPILFVKYKPDSPVFTIRDIFRSIEGLNSNFKPSLYHAPTIEDRAREMHAQERRRVLFRLLLSVAIAVPTFILGIVFMSLVKEAHPVRRYIMQPMWVGNATRLNWALFILATPVYFFAADTFHRRAFKEVKAMWRPGSRTPFVHRFIRFGSMNMLMSLGTSIAYFASIVELGLAAANKSSGSMNDSYFDAVVFLTMFILIGRFLEAYSKAKTGDAVTSLGRLRPEESVLVDPEKGDSNIATELLEVGDVVRVRHGMSPPFDGTILDGATTFDESSLTGESRPVNKEPGETVYSGTVNKGAPVKVKITTVAGASMLDQIINAVREGQTHRAPVERVADTITSHFVPFVVVVAVSTWFIWLILGTTETIPKDWMNEGSGGWALWSLRFAIAVFVIACPCGIGLAAPTALFVGGGLAAQHGILVKGGGEAFQEASTLDCIVFDKTGTLTEGGDPAVTDHSFRLECDHGPAVVFGLARSLEENSNHPIAKALVDFCKPRSSGTLETVAVDEVPGKGLKGVFQLNDQKITVIAGNEAFMSDHSVAIPVAQSSVLQMWKARGESVALLALLSGPNNKGDPAVEEHWELACAFAIADPLRPEATNVISQLKKRGIDVWMLSGDNQITANAVGVQVGIPVSNIIAGVLPDEKAEKIAYLQRTLTKTHKSTFSGLPFLGRSTTKRATIAMVGDGINDAPALSTADLSIAIGSGSDIALSSSSFILINSHLTSLLTLLDLSRVVFRRVYFNFGWALVYNLLAMPIAAGVLYPITTGVEHMDMHHNGVGMEGGMGMGDTGVKHVRLDPVWASLAMALSSVSVVCSSLLLRSKLPVVGFRVKEPHGTSA